MSPDGPSVTSNFALGRAQTDKAKPFRNTFGCGLQATPRRPIGQIIFVSAFELEGKLAFLIYYIPLWLEHLLAPDAL